MPKSRSRSKSRSRLKPIEGVAVFESSTSLSGYVTLKELNSRETVIHANIKGLKPNQKYAWHIHEAGDLRANSKSEKCKGACAHYNPHNKNHGGPKDRERHVGDLGNITTDNKGDSKTKIIMKGVKLHGKYSVMGRSIVIHKLADDLGRGGTKESLTTGSAGARIACGVIGYSKGSKLYF